MIIGKGLIASAFIRAEFDSAHHLIFASGVSNSTETDPAAFTRELDLIRHHLAKNTTFVYFSTISVFDPSRQASPYIQHKKQIEKIIRSEADRYLIIRLPIMLGRSENPYTLINYLVRAIVRQAPIQIHAHACRHLLDIDDLVPFATPYFLRADEKICINIPGSVAIYAPALMHKLETLLHRQGQYEIIDAGACFALPQNEGDILYASDPDYIDHVLTKYYGGDRTIIATT